MNIFDKAQQMISKNEIKEASSNFLEDALNALLGNPVSLGKIVIAVSKSPFFIRDRIFWSNFEVFLSGLYVTDTYRGKFCSKLAVDGKQQENASRIIGYIERVETKQKAKYLANASRALSADFITLADFFRICHAITSNIDEDLQFLAKNIQKKDMEYSIPIQGLFSSGLMCQSVIDANGNQKYSFTPLADLVDRFSVSFESMERYPDPTKGQLKSAPQINIQSLEWQEVEEKLGSI